MMTKEEHSKKFLALLKPQLKFIIKDWADAEISQILIILIKLRILLPDINTNTELSIGSSLLLKELHQTFSSTFCFFICTWTQIVNIIELQGIILPPLTYFEERCACNHIIFGITKYKELIVVCTFLEVFGWKKVKVVDGIPMFDSNRILPLNAAVYYLYKLSNIGRNCGF